MLVLLSALCCFDGRTKNSLLSAVSDLDFELPPELIAQEASPDRDQSRLLHLDRTTRARTHHRVGDLPCLLRSGDLLVVNNSRVFPARLLGRREPSGGHVECLLLARLGEDRWDVLIRPGQKMRVGEHAVFGDGDNRLHLEVLERRFYGRRIVRLFSDGPHEVDAVVDRIGQTPLPPYIKRPPDRVDRDRYQTIFAKVRGSIAAPTAGLHFTPELVSRLASAGVAQAEVTLHVGYGTFQPIRVERVEDHTVAAESYEISKTAAGQINAARDEGRRIVAVGTTTTRVLESVVRVADGRMKSMSGVTDLYIHPGFDFRVVGALVTNFHLPRSSLLVLAAAFAGRDVLLKAYAEAIAERYRFYSYGDATLIT